MEQIQENKKFEVVLFLRKEPDFREEISVKFIEDGNYPYGFERVESVFVKQSTHEDGAMNFSYAIGQDNGVFRSPSVGDVFRVTSKDSEKFYMVVDVGFDEFNPVTGKFI